MRLRQGEGRRGSRHERGYDSRWAAFSAIYLKAHPFCVECGRQGRDRLADLVDHKHPVRDGGPWFDKGNLWAMCRPHHDRWKRRLEAYARANGAIGQVRVWCDHPEQRPERLRGDNDGSAGAS